MLPLDRAGQVIGMGDSLIAGIVLAHRLPLLTRHTAHFERVENLELVKMTSIRISLYHPATKSRRVAGV